MVPWDSATEFGAATSQRVEERQHRFGRPLHVGLVHTRSRRGRPIGDDVAVDRDVRVTHSRATSRGKAVHARRGGGVHGLSDGVARQLVDRSAMLDLMPLLRGRDGGVAGTLALDDAKELHAAPDVGSDLWP